jgi:hypothetical protein
VGRGHGEDGELRAYGDAQAAVDALAVGHDRIVISLGVEALRASQDVLGAELDAELAPLAMALLEEHYPPDC